MLDMSSYYKEAFVKKTTKNIALDAIKRHYHDFISVITEK